MAKYYIKNIPLWNDNVGSFKSSPINTDDLNYLIENLETFRIHLSFNDKYTGENNAPVYQMSIGGDSDYEGATQIYSNEELLKIALGNAMYLLKKDSDNGQIQSIVNVLSDLLQRFKGDE